MIRNESDIGNSIESYQRYNSNDNQYRSRPIVVRCRHCGVPINSDGRSVLDHAAGCPLGAFTVASRDREGDER